MSESALMNSMPPDTWAINWRELPAGRLGSASLLAPKRTPTIPRQLDGEFRVTRARMIAPVANVRV
jgi:hypothetical protein